MMRVLGRAAALILTVTCVAPGADVPEVKFSMAEWDSPLIPLEITPYYLRVNSPVKAKAVSMDLDLYVKGKFVRTMSLGRIAAAQPQPVKVNCALYLDTKTEGKVTGTWVIDWAGSRGTGKFYLPAGDFPMEEGLSSAFEGAAKLPPFGQTPLFVILAGGGGFSMPASIKDAPGANPNLSVLVGILRTE